MLQNILNNIDDRVLAFDTNLKLIAINRNMYDDYLTAFGVKLVPGVSVLEKTPEPIFSMWNERYQRVLKGEFIDINEEFGIVGVPIHSSIRLSPLIVNNSIIGGTLHSRDTSLQRLAEQKNKENEQHLYAQINNTQESLWSVDTDCRILTIKQVFQNDFNTVFGHKLIKGDCVLDYLKGDLRAEWKERYDLAFSGQKFTKTDKFEFDNFLLHAEVSFNPIVVNGEVVGATGFTRDITENVLKQQELEKALEKAKESDYLKSAFIANISHEIRSPLNSVLGFAELAFDDDYDHSKKEKFRKNMLMSGSHLLDVINGIIDISLIESGQMEVHSEPFEINQLLQNCVVQIQAAQKSTDPEIVFKNAPAHIILSDKKHVKQILLNLLTNANKFTLKGQITVSSSIENKRIIISVQDTGVGIPKNIGDRLFDRFYRTKESIELTAGTGLGLSISKALVEKLGGEIWYESEVGVGTTFNFSLPLK